MCYLSEFEYFIINQIFVVTSLIARVKLLYYLSWLMIIKKKLNIQLFKNNFLFILINFILFQYFVNFGI